MKNNKKIIISLIIAFVMITSAILVNRGTFNSLFNPKNNSKEKTIQARLVDAGNLNYVEIAGRYEGILTFKNLGDGVLHTYFVCLEDKSIVQLNAVYGLRVDYYVPHGGPNESMMTNGCNGLNPPNR